MIDSKSIIMSDGLSLETEIKMLKKYMEIGANTPDYAMILVNQSPKITTGEEGYETVPLTPNGEHQYKNSFLQVNDDGSISAIASTGTFIWWSYDICCSNNFGEDVFLRTSFYSYDTDVEQKAAIPSTIRNKVFSMPRNTTGDYVAPTGSHARYNVNASGVFNMTQGKRYIFGMQGQRPSGNQTEYQMDTRIILIAGRGY